MANKGNKGKTGGRFAGKAKGGTSKLESRVAALEKRIGVSHETQDFIDRVKAKGPAPVTASTRAFNSLRVLSSDAVAPVQTIDVGFDLSNTPKAPGMVRLYLPGTKSGDEIA